jgi:tetratricopeptide (TPR) repeat protein
LGNIFREMGRFDEAQDFLNRALETAQFVGDVRGQGVWLFNLALLHGELDRPEAALNALQLSTQIARIMRDQRGLAQRLPHLIDNALKADEQAEAVKGLQELAALHKNLGEMIPAAARLVALGDLHHHMATQAGHEFEASLYYSLALDSYHEALHLLHNEHAPDAEAEVLFNIGSVHGNMGAFQSAADSFAAAYSLFERAGLPERMQAALKQMHLAKSYLAQS